MAISKHLERFAGKPVVDFQPSKGLRSPASSAIRLRCEYRWGETSNENFAQRMAMLLSDANAAKIQALVIGCWDGAWEGSTPDEAIEMLVGGRDKLMALEALFFGDIIYTEYEISWLRQGDVSPLLGAYGNLEEFAVRGAGGLRIGHLTHRKLKKLVIQAGGLPRDILEELSHCQFPALEHLELWLGREEYGGDIRLEHLTPLLKGNMFPKLRHLGLRNRESLGTVAEAIAQSPIVRKLHSLDLSMGSLNDAEAEPLLQVAQLKKLKLFDLSDNYITPAMVRRFKKTGIKVRAENLRKPDCYDGEEYRYCVVGE